MRFARTGAALLAVGMLVLPATTARAESSAVSAAVNGFRGGEHVYVDRSAEAADKVDAAAIRSRIESTGVAVFVAVLPDSAAAGGSADDVPREILRGLDRSATVAVLVGRRFRAASSALAPGQAAGLATEAFRAKGSAGFTRDGVTGTLTYFVDEVDRATNSQHRPGLEPVRTTSHGAGLASMLLVLAAFAAVVLIGLGFLRRRGGRAQVARLRAEAERWYNRLGGEVMNLSAGDNDAARQALADASERYNAAGSELSQARTEHDYRAARDTALEGMHFARAARSALGIDPGPELPPTSAQEAAGRVQREQTVDLAGQPVAARPDYAEDAPYYYPGGIVGGGRVPAGWYSQPFWKTALIGGAAGLGGVLLADALFDSIRGPYWGGWGGFGGWGGGYGYGPGYDTNADMTGAIGGDDWGSGGGGDFGGGDFGGGDFGGGDFGGDGGDF